MRDPIILAVALTVVLVLGAALLASTPTREPGIVQPPTRPARRVDDWDTGVIPRAVVPARAHIATHRPRA